MTQEIAPQPHFISASCGGERCRCGAAATHKVGEEIPHDEPCRTCGRTWRENMWEHRLLDRRHPTWCDDAYHIAHDGASRHNLTAYVCCTCFTRLLGPATGCPTGPMEGT